MRETTSSACHRTRHDICSRGCHASYRLACTALTAVRPCCHALAPLRRDHHSSFRKLKAASSYERAPTRASRKMSSKSSMKLSPRRSSFGPHSPRTGPAPGTPPVAPSSGTEKVNRGIARMPASRIGSSPSRKASGRPRPLPRVQPHLRSRREQCAPHAGGLPPLIVESVQRAHKLLRGTLALCLQDSN